MSYSPTNDDSAPAAVAAPAGAGVTATLPGSDGGARTLRAYDLTHPFTIHTPGWVGYPSPKLSYFQRHATHGIVSQMLELPLHSGTHFDAEMHIVSGGADLASVPMDRLLHEGVVVDIAEEMEDWGLIEPHHITDRIEVKKGDILLYHTGWSRFFNGGAEEDEERYYLRHPGGSRAFAEWIVEMELSWTGFDCGSGDNPLNTSIRTKWRPEIAQQYRDRTGADVDELFPPEDIFVMHRVPFRAGITHVENLGGELGAVGTRRCLIGAFPMPIVGGEASPCRVMAFVEEDG
jgi:kynurenine formamidase